MNRHDGGVDEFLADQHDPTLDRIDALVVAAMPGRSRDLWTGTFWGGTEQAIVGYGRIFEPRPRGESVEWFAVGLARQKRHYSLYVSAVEDGRYVGQVYAPRLGKVKAGASSLGFRSLDDLDLDVLGEMLTHVDRITPP